MSSAASNGNNASSQPSEEFDDDCQAIFPQRLMGILSDDSNTEAICWLPHGRAFVIRNRQLFADKVMPKYFSRKSKYSSFTRKLNRWDFQRVSSGPEMGAYYHEFFLRDKPQLAAQMFCKNQRTKMAMASSAASPASMIMSAAAPATASVKSPPCTSNGNSTAAANPNTHNKDKALSDDKNGSVSASRNTLLMNPLVVEQKLLEQKLGCGETMDIAQLLLAGQRGMDRQTQMVMEQQLIFMKQQQELERLKQLQQQQQQQLVSSRSDGNFAMPSHRHVQDQLLSILNEKNADINQFLQRASTSAATPSPLNPILTGMSNLGINNTPPSNSFDALALQQQIQEIQAHKQQQARMLQLQQLMALNVQRQQKNRRSNNFRASAA